MSQRYLESLVGLFLLAALFAFSLLALKVSGLTNIFETKAYHVTAKFDEIGSLKIRAPVKIGGVQVGEVTKIALDPLTFKAVVHMRINQNYNDIPDDSQAGILTSGLLGDNYIAITPMYNKSVLKDGSEFQFTNSAMVLEKLIGQLIYKISNNGNDEGTQTEESTKKGA